LVVGKGWIFLGSGFKGSYASGSFRNSEIPGFRTSLNLEPERDINTIEIYLDNIEF